MKKISKITLIVVILLLVSSVVLSASFTMNEEYLNNFYKFFSSFYYKEIKTDDVLGGSFNGLLDENSLFSCYEQQEITNKFQLNVLGVSVEKIRTGFLVSNVYPGSNASELGIEAGDIIYSINRISTSIMNCNDLDNYILQLGGKSLIEVVKRDSGIIEKINCELKPGYLSTTDFFIADEIGYIRINKFEEKTSQDVKEAINWFNNNNVEYIILDLRDLMSMNIEEAIEITDLFLPYGRIASGANKIYSANYKKNYSSVNVIINNYSMGAPEVIARAIKNYNTGVVYGQKTFGQVELVETYPVFTDEAYLKYSKLANSDDIKVIVNYLNARNEEIKKEDISGFLHIVEDVLKDNKNITYEKGVTPDFETNTKRESININPQKKAIWIRKDYEVGELSYDIFIAEQELYNMGFFKNKPDVTYDENTRIAVNKYKQSIGLEQDGILDMTTQAILNFNRFKENILNEKCLIEVLEIIRGNVNE